jgi:hypothetical protein
MSNSTRAIFTQEELNSNDGMLTTVWGPALWHTLHTISFNYPVNPTQEQRQQYKEFILSLRNVMPCGACRRNLTTNLEKCELNSHALKNRKNFSRWMYRLHEQINTMLGKSSGLSYEDVAQRYENFRARCRPGGAPTIPHHPGSVDHPKKIESGCVEPVTGVKSRCVISIIPQQVEYPTFVMDDKCYQRRLGDKPPA